MSELTLDQRKELEKPLPQEALKQHPSRPYLTTINPIYIIERLNDVFGIDGWRAVYKRMERKEKDVVMRCALFVPKYNISKIQFGGNDNPDLGDAYKGAATDALTKCASYLGIGIDIYKNKKGGGAETSQIDHIESLLATSSLPNDEKERIEHALFDLTFIRAKECIDYLKENQLEPLDGKVIQQKDINKQLDKKV